MIFVEGSGTGSSNYICASLVSEYAFILDEDALLPDWNGLTSALRCNDSKPKPVLGQPVKLRDSGDLAKAAELFHIIFISTVSVAKAKTQNSDLSILVHSAYGIRA